VLAVSEGMLYTHGKTRAQARPKTFALPGWLARSHAGQLRYQVSLLRDVFD
jgi:hypothetical protein